MPRRNHSDALRQAKAPGETAKGWGHSNPAGREIAATCFELVPPDCSQLPMEQMKAHSRAEWAFHQWNELGMSSIQEL